MCIYIYILESTGALRAPLILRMPLSVAGSMAFKVAVLETWIWAAAWSRLASTSPPLIRSSTIAARGPICFGG